MTDLIWRHVYLADTTATVVARPCGSAEVEFMAGPPRAWVVARARLDSVQDLERVRDAINAVLVEARS